MNGEDMNGEEGEYRVGVVSSHKGCIQLIVFQSKETVQYLVRLQLFGGKIQFSIFTVAADMHTGWSCSSLLLPISMVPTTTFELDDILFCGRGYKLINY